MPLETDLRDLTFTLGVLAKLRDETLENLLRLHNSENWREIMERVSEIVQSSRDTIVAFNRMVAVEMEFLDRTNDWALRRLGAIESPELVISDNIATVDEGYVTPKKNTHATTRRRSRSATHCPENPCFIDFNEMDNTGTNVQNDTFASKIVTNVPHNLPRLQLHRTNGHLQSASVIFPRTSTPKVPSTCLAMPESPVLHNSTMSNSMTPMRFHLIPKTPHSGRMAALRRPYKHGTPVLNLDESSLK